MVQCNLFMPDVTPVSYDTTSPLMRWRTTGIQACVSAEMLLRIRGQSKDGLVTISPSLWTFEASGITARILRNSSFAKDGGTGCVHFSIGLLAWLSNSNRKY